MGEIAVLKIGDVIEEDGTATSHSVRRTFITTSQLVHDAAVHLCERRLGANGSEPTLIPSLSSENMLPVSCDGNSQHLDDCHQATIGASMDKLSTSFHEMTLRWTKEVNQNQPDGCKITLIDGLGCNLNARSSQTQDGFQIEMHRGIIEKSFQIIGQNIDYYLKKYANSLEKEFCVVIGCNIIWTALYGHELGHILRGHLINYPGNSCQVVDQPESLVAFGEKAGYPFDTSRTRLLMEFDADVYSATYITRQLVELIAKAEMDGIANAESIIDIAISSLFFLFNELCRLEGQTTKYPPATVRLNCLLNFSGEMLQLLTKHRADLKCIVSDSVQSAFNFLIDESALSQSFSHESLNRLDSIEQEIVDDYKKFLQIQASIATK